MIKIKTPTTPSADKDVRQQEPHASWGYRTEHSPQEGGSLVSPEFNIYLVDAWESHCWDLTLEK